VVINGKHDWVDLTISHESPQSGRGGDRGSSTSASRRDHGGGVGLHDESAVKDDSSIKARIVDRGTSSLLKTKLIPGSYEMSNSSVMRASLYRTLGNKCAKHATFSQSQSDS